MSRIADVLRKARDESAAADEPRGADDAGLRALSDVKIPWSFTELPNVAAARVEPNINPVADPDAIGDLVQRLFVACDQRGAKLRRVLFASVDGSRGALEVAAAVAEKLAAATTATVCLADLDLRQPTLHLRYPLEGKLGLLDAVSEPGPLRDCAHRSPSIVNLWLLPAGLRQTEVRSVFDDAPSLGRLSKLLETFDLVVATTAPVGVDPAAALLGAVFDGIVLVVDADSTKPETVRAAAAVLQSGKIALVGTLLRHNRAASA